MPTPEQLARQRIDDLPTSAGWVVQDPNDEPAAVLQDKIREEQVRVKKSNKPIIISKHNQLHFFNKDKDMRDDAYSDDVDR